MAAKAKRRSLFLSIQGHSLAKRNSVFSREIRPTPGVFFCRQEYYSRARLARFQATGGGWPRC
jgi:hypothetical protein